MFQKKKKASQNKLEENGKIGTSRGDPSRDLSDLTEIPPPYRETSVANPLSHCVFRSIADYRCYTPTLSVKMAYRSPKTGGTAEKLASEAYPATGGIA